MELMLLAADRTRPVEVDIVAYSGGITDVAPFSRVVVDLAGLELPTTVTLLAEHKNVIDAVAGTGRPMIHDGRLLVRGIVTVNSPAGSLVFGLHQDGVPLGASIGATPLKMQRVPIGQSVFANGKLHSAGRLPFRLFTQSRLREVSFVPRLSEGTHVTFDRKGVS